MMAEEPLLPSPVQLRVSSGGACGKANVTWGVTPLDASLEDTEITAGVVTIPHGEIRRVFLCYELTYTCMCSGIWWCLSVQWCCLYMYFLLPLISPSFSPSLPPIELPKTHIRKTNTRKSDIKSLASLCFHY